MSIHTCSGPVFQVTLGFIWLFFLFLSLPSQDSVCLSQRFDLVPQYLICLRHLADFFHQLINVALVCGCGQCKVVESGGYSPGQDHIIHAVISRLSCAQLLGDIEVVIFALKNFLNPIHILPFEGFYLHSLHAST